MLLFQNLEAAFINFKEKWSTFLVLGTFLPLPCPSHLELLACTNWAKITSEYESSSFVNWFLVSGEEHLEFKLVPVAGIKVKVVPLMMAAAVHTWETLLVLTGWLKSPFLLRRSVCFFHLSPLWTTTSWKGEKNKMFFSPLAGAIGEPHDSSFLTL